jgi:periplasmic divalent cation tolerance protein
VSSAAESSAVIVLTTVGADTDAAELARTLVDQRLVDCVNIVAGVTSIYRWKESVEQDEEQLLVMKTTTDLLVALEARLRELHPYELPEFLVVPVSGGSEAYLGWLCGSVG